MLLLQLLPLSLLVLPCLPRVPLREQRHPAAEFRSVERRRRRDGGEEKARSE